MNGLPRVALTGGIASGKSEVSRRFSELGVCVIDTDLIAHELVEPGTPALAQIVRHFGDAVLDQNAALDRRALRELVFDDPAQRKALELILHPLIMATAEQRIGEADGRYCIVVIPLLVETGLQQWADRVLVVDVSRQTQIKRLMVRDKMSRKNALAMLAAQTSRARRNAAADDIIVNDGSLEDLHADVERLHKDYRSRWSTSAQSA